MYNSDLWVASQDQTADTVLFCNVINSFELPIPGTLRKASRVLIVEMLRQSKPDIFLQKQLDFRCKQSVSVVVLILARDKPGNDLRAPNKTYDNPSAFNASCTFGRAFMRSMKALTFGKGERSNSTRGAQRVTV